MTILIGEVFCNVTQNCQFGETPPNEPYTQRLGALFKSLRAEYGRPSRVYLDTKSRGAIHCGWCFTKRMRYEGAPTSTPDDFYIREVWVTLYETCEVTDPLALTSTSHKGAKTIHPFKTADIAALKRAERKANM